MIIPGLCSISFRNHTAKEIIDKCAELKVPAIEWGGDLHVPHGNPDMAARIRDACVEQGIICPSYGSYYRTASSEGEGLSFTSVLNSAVIMGCRTIRVWAGLFSPFEADDAYYQAVAEDTRRIAALAEEKGITISFEYHDNTLTQTAQSLKKLDNLIAHHNVFYYWQPPHGFSDEQCVDSLRAIGNKLSNLHLFYWKLTGLSGPDRIDRRPLSEGAERWKKIIKTVSVMPNVRDPSLKGSDTPRYALMEFVRGDSFEQFEADWQILSNQLLS